MIKKTILFLLFLSATALAEVISEQSTDVGFGFREVYQQVKMPKEHWEGVGHFRFLYFKDVKLSQTTHYLISSDGSFVVFTDGPTGNVKVFYPSSRMSITLEQYVKGNGIPISYKELELGKVKVSFAKGKENVFSVTNKP